MVLTKIVAIYALVCFASSLDANVIVRMIAKPLTRSGASDLPTPDWMAKLRSTIASAVTEGRLLAATGLVTSPENCQKVKQTPSVEVNQVGGPATKERSSIAFKVSVGRKSGGRAYLPADEVVRSLDLIHFKELSAYQGINVSFYEIFEDEKEKESGSGPGESGSADGDVGGLPIDDDDRDASGDDEKPSAAGPGSVSIRFPSDRLRESATEVEQEDFENVLRHCFNRHMDKFVEKTAKSEQCVVLHFLAKHTGSSVDRVAQTVNQLLLPKGRRHRCDILTSLTTPPPSARPKVITDKLGETGTKGKADGSVTAEPSPGLDLSNKKEPETGGGLQLALYIVIGLVSLALVVLAINLVIFAVKRRQLKVAAVTKSSPPPNNMCTTKIELDDQDSVSVKLASGGITNPQAGGVQNQWEEEDGSSLEEKA
eukprot:m.306417 g.306417  ORF g.306417 m.306417 type:complete len:427 (+) comp41221_c0_seq1:207-1487(+)